MNFLRLKRILLRLCCVIALWLLPIVSAFAAETNLVVTETNAVAATANVVATTSNAFTATTNAFAATSKVAATTANFPGMTGSVVRMLGGLAFVFALFFGGVWLFKNWQRVSRVRRKSNLNVFEARSLGPRQALYVVGYQQQRFLVSASQAGISLISVLPAAAPEDDTLPAATNGASSFAQVLQNVLGRK